MASPPPDRRRRLAVGGGAAALGLLAAAAVVGLAVARAGGPSAAFDRWTEDLTGANPHPVKLLRPADAPLSALASLGEKIFNDPALSASGRQSCASCHDPTRAYGPPNGLDVQRGGPHGDLQGFRPPPSLAYLYRQGPFTIGPATAETDDVIPLDQLAQKAQGAPRAVKSAGAAPAAGQMVPSGGLFWDGRDDTFMDQAQGPITNPSEMAVHDPGAVAARLQRAPYARDFQPLFGAAVLANPQMLFAEAMSALSRYQVEAKGFHRFDSKYDHWLEGRARLSPAEMRGLRLFNDPAKGDCAACHLSQPGKDGLPPLFTDAEYEALGVPRNRRLAVNRDPNFYDMGICGPLRKDLARQTQYCGMFLTPTLRNSARRGVYFHNGVYHDLKQVLAFYNFRDVAPGRVYPRNAVGRVQTFDDLPARFHANIDTADAPFDRRRGDAPAMSGRDMDDIIAFIRTLDDGDGAPRPAR